MADNQDIINLRLDFNVIDTYNGSSRFQPDLRGRRPFNFEEDLNSTPHDIRDNSKDKDSRAGAAYHVFRDSIASQEKILAQETVITTDDQELLNGSRPPK